MTDTTSPRVLLETLWEKAGLEGAVTLPVNATITAYTLAARRPARAPEGGPAVTPSAEDLALALYPEAPATLSTVPLDAERIQPGAATGTELQVVGLLGEGGMGRVLLARQRSLGREVAVKVVRKSGLDAGERLAAAASLLAEARVTGLLEHPSIVPVHALGRDDDGLPVLVMKRIEGVPWDTLLDRPEHPAWESIPSAREDRLSAQIDIAMDVCNALHFAHSRGIVHRDIKPENVMIGSFGEVYLADWGIATRAVERTASGEAHPTPLVGTPAYMAPEMLLGDLARIDARTDVFLLGATLHRVLTGEHRNPGATVHEALLSAYEPRPVEYPATVPSELAAICNRATAREPSERYASARELRQALAEFLRHRHAIGLAEIATERLRELHELLARTDADAREINRLSSECRFAFAESLREYPGNAVARRGLQRALETLLELELGRENADAVRALVSELPEPRPEFAERLAALESALGKRREGEARLARLEREFDPAVGARPRMWSVGAVLLTALTLTGITLRQYVKSGSAVAMLTSRQLVVANLRYIAVVAVMLVVGRKQLRATTLNRRIVAALCTALLATLVHRIVGHSQHDAVPSIMTGDLLMLAAVTAVATFTIARGLWPIPMSYFVAMLAGVAYSRHLPLIFGLANIFAMSSYAVWTWGGHRGLPSGSPPAPPPPQ